MILLGPDTPVLFVSQGAIPGWQRVCPGSEKKNQWAKEFQDFDHILTIFDLKGVAQVLLSLCQHNQSYLMSWRSSREAHSHG